MDAYVCWAGGHNVDELHAAYGSLFAGRIIQVVGGKAVPPNEWWARLYAKVRKLPPQLADAAGWFVDDEAYGVPLTAEKLARRHNVSAYLHHRLAIKYEREISGMWFPDRGLELGGQDFVPCYAGSIRDLRRYRALVANQLRDRDPKRTIPTFRVAGAKEPLSPELLVAGLDLAATLGFERVMEWVDTRHAWDLRGVLSFPRAMAELRGTPMTIDDVIELNASYVAAIDTRRRAA